MTGWYVARCECRVCPDGAPHLSVFPTEADPDTLECPRCHAMSSEAVEYFPPDKTESELDELLKRTLDLSLPLGTRCEGLSLYRLPGEEESAMPEGQMQIERQKLEEFLQQAVDTAAGVQPETYTILDPRPEFIAEVDALRGLRRWILDRGRELGVIPKRDDPSPFDERRLRELELKRAEGPPATDPGPAIYGREPAAGGE